MDFESLVSAESGIVEVVEFSWPPPSEDQEALSCAAYVLMKRPEGFLLCLPQQFLPDGLLDLGNAVETGEGVGPSLSLEAPAVSITASGDWISPPEQRQVPALVVDLPASFCDLLSSPDLADFQGQTFLEDEPSLFPLASSVLTQVREWLLSGIGEARSGYHTGVSGTEAPAAKAMIPPSRAAPAKRGLPKRPTVANLAAQQEVLAGLVTNLATQVQGLMDPNMPRTPPGPKPAPQEHMPSARPLARPLASPVSQSLMIGLRAPPKQLAVKLGSPPPARLHFGRVGGLPEEPQQQTIFDGELPVGNAEGNADSSLAQAMLLQSQALTTLVSQIAAGSADPLSDLSTGASVSTKGTLRRQRLQAELASGSGGFFKTVYLSSARRMMPSATGLSIEEAAAQGHTLCRYLERYGGFGKQKDLGLIMWQLAMMGDFLAINQPERARDTLGLLLVMLEQMALDQGKVDLGWILSLQQDPPSAVFQDHQHLPTANLRPFSPLADPKWISIALAYVKEQDTLSSKRLELSKAKPPSGSNLGSPPPAAQKEQLTRKQLRAKQWAEKKAAAAATSS